MKTILVPVDLSPAAPRVCAAACVLARQNRARLVLLHVVQLPPVVLNGLYPYDAGALADVITADEKRAARTLATLARRCGRRGVAVRTEQRSGLPVFEILAAAAACRAAYLVLGSHGHGIAYDLLVGSTTQGVLRQAPCPVLVVPTKRK